jgi:hypothetical protein
VKVVFSVRGTSQTFTQSVPKIASGGTHTATFVPPIGCSSPDCNFTITVDSQNQVKEKVETKNTASARCLG